MIYYILTELCIQLYNLWNNKLNSKFNTYILGWNSRLPHNLNLGDVRGIQDILEDRPEYYEAFQTLFKGHLAQSSHKAYDWILRPFKTYCHTYGKFSIISITDGQININNRQY